MNMIREFGSFLWHNWRWWLLPIVVILAAVAGLNYFFPIPFQP